MKKSIFYIISWVALVVLVLVSAVALFTNLKEDAPIQVNVADIVNVQSETQTQPIACTTLNTGCSAIINGVTIVLKFPQNIIYLNPFSVEVSLPNDEIIQVEDVKIDFQMLKMNMGINYYQLQQDASNKSLWTGKSVLPICVTGRTDWQAHVEIKAKDKIYKAVFQFEVLPSTQ